MPRRVGRKLSSKRISLLFRLMLELCDRALKPSYDGLFQFLVIITPIQTCKGYPASFKGM
jgi:hypothetical protein